jgi:hypothetical protein
MAYFLILLSCSQFILRAMTLQETPVYAVLNAYVLLMPLLLIWLGDYCLRRRTPDKNLFAGLLVVAAIQAYVIPAYLRAPDFMALYAKSIQFFWGPAILLPCLLGLFRLWSVERDPMATARTFIRGLSCIVAAVTLFEVVAVDLLGISAFSLPWIAYARDLNPIDIFPFRPWGVSIAPQVNALMLALLFWLSYLYRVRGLLHRVALVVALVVSLGGTGQLAFVILIPLCMRRPVLGIAVCGLLLGVLIGIATFFAQNRTGSDIQKFDFAYALLIARRLSEILGFYLSRLSADEIMFGSQTVTIYSVTGLTHDWAYFDVFYSYGLIGLIGYVLLYGTLIFLACPMQYGAAKRLYFVLAVLALNFHYGALNYYLGQFLFSILAALQLQRPSIRASRNRQRPIAAMVPPSAVGA